MDANLKKLTAAIDYNNNYEKKVEGAADHISQFLELKSIKNFSPEFGIVLGSGLADLANSIDVYAELSYSEIQDFPQTTVEGHEGKLIFGKLMGVDVIGLSGRKHYYEVAHEPFNNGILQTVFPVHVLANLGVPNYFVTNAAGGLNLDYNVGDMMVIKSHINNLPNPLLGRHLNFKRVDSNERILRFQPMNGEYAKDLVEMLWTNGALNCNGKVHRGVYMAVPGPSYETEAECIAFRKLGADAVGMSTANEVIVARNRGMFVVGFSCITNKIAEDGTNATNHEEVKAILESDEVKCGLESSVKGFFSAYKRHYM